MMEVRYFPLKSKAAGKWWPFKTSLDNSCIIPNGQECAPCILA